jgi:phosphoserine phosphatase
MKAAFFDLDGTLTEHRVWSGLLDYFKVNRIRLFRHYLFTFLHYGLYLLYKLGLVSQVNFRSIWAKNLSWHFAGFSLEKTAEIWDWVIEHRMKGQWRTDILAMLQQHKSDGDVPVANRYSRDAPAAQI